MKNVQIKSNIKQIDDESLIKLNQKSDFQNLNDDSTSSSENNRKSDTLKKQVAQNENKESNDNENMQQQMNLNFLSTKLQKLEKTYFQMEKSYVQRIKILKKQLNTKNSDSEVLNKILKNLSSQNNKQKQKLQQYLRQIKQAQKQQFKGQDEKNDEKQINVSYYALHKQENKRSSQLSPKKQKLKKSTQKNIRTSDSIGRYLLKKNSKNNKLAYASYGQEQFMKLKKIIQRSKEKTNVLNSCKLQINKKALQSSEIISKNC